MTYVKNAVATDSGLSSQQCRPCSWIDVLFITLPAYNPIGCFAITKFSWFRKKQKWYETIKHRKTDKHAKNLRATKQLGLGTQWPEKI